ncbi:hypothetical protein DID88_006717 [Monilinia fructigena]|uniref:Uncharacterized protein n=1 Tax=Monilinia fructigena TaxID=38457 RepID=A0A395IG71_9HELO|nr:hypothetical protein DID88_006717 [Monilinia fructigena]
MGQLGDLSPRESVAIGILVGLISTSVQSLGLTLQRKSHILEDEKGAHHVRRPPYRRRRWQLGMGMFIISNLVGSTIQITTLPLPVLSTLQASGLVFNSICATLILGEPFTRWSLGGTLLVSTGAILIAIFGAIPEPAHTLDQLLLLLGRRTLSALHAGLIALGTVILLSGVLALSWRLNEEQTQPAVAQSALAPGLGLVEDTDDSSESFYSRRRSSYRCGKSSPPKWRTHDPYHPNITLLSALLDMLEKQSVSQRSNEIWGELEDDDANSIPTRANRPRPPRPDSAPTLPRSSTYDEERDPTNPLQQ